MKQPFWKLICRFLLSNSSTYRESTSIAMARVREAGWHAPNGQRRASGPYLWNWVQEVPPGHPPRSPRSASNSRCPETAPPRPSHTTAPFLPRAHMGCGAGAQAKSFPLAALSRLPCEPVSRVPGCLGTLATLRAEERRSRAIPSPLLRMAFPALARASPQVTSLTSRGQPLPLPQHPRGADSFLCALVGFLGSFFC